jgi:hypothetical protein
LFFPILALGHGEVAFDGLAYIVAGGGPAVLGAWWPSGAGLAGFRCTGGQGGRRSDVPKPTADKLIACVESSIGSPPQLDLERHEQSVQVIAIRMQRVSRTG